MKSLIHTLEKSKNTLVFAVGGGNDSVTSLFVLEYLSKQFMFKPKNMDIIAMLPDVLKYSGLTDTGVKNIYQVRNNSSRYVGDTEIGKFPEQVLVKHLKEAPLKIGKVYGMYMCDGSIGVSEALMSLVKTHKYDLVIALDVGGDFIAHSSNEDVLSPMMDGYSLHALKSLPVPVLYGVYGLGNDGESTEQMLNLALSNIQDSYEFKMDDYTTQESIDYYRKYVEPVRYSRTADFTAMDIQNIEHQNPCNYRARFHVKLKDGTVRTEYGYFAHTTADKFKAKLYLFDDVSNVVNPFSILCKHSLEWFLKVQSKGTRFNTELNGQTIYDLSFLDDDLSTSNLYFGTPSLKFDDSTVASLTKDIVESVRSDVYTYALVWTSALDSLDVKGFEVFQFNDMLSVIGRNVHNAFKQLKF